MVEEQRRRQRQEKGKGKEKIGGLSCTVERAITEQLSRRTPEEINSVCEILLQKFVNNHSSSSSSHHKKDVWCTEENLKRIKKMIEHVELHASVKVSSSELKCDLARYLYLSNEASQILESLPRANAGVGAIAGIISEEENEAEEEEETMAENEWSSDEEVEEATQQIASPSSSSASFLFQETPRNDSVSSRSDQAPSLSFSTVLSFDLLSDLLSDLISTDTSSFED